MKHDPNNTSCKSWWESRANWVLLAFLAIAGFYLIAEHRAHVFGALPFLILLACPLMHVFMHRGHGKHGNESLSEERDHGKTGEKQ